MLKIYQMKPFYGSSNTNHVEAFLAMSIPSTAPPSSENERDEIIRRQMALFKKKRMTMHCLDPAKAYADVYLAGADAAKRYVERKVSN